MEKNHDTAKDGERKNEDTKGSSEEQNSNKGVAKIEVKDGMTEMESMFLAIAQLDPSSNKTEIEASQAMAHKQIYDVDAPGPILLDSAGQLLKLTTLDDPIDVDATIHIPTDVDDLASHDDEVAFIIPQELKGVYEFTGVEEFSPERF